jgi:hypothetical protein
MGWIYQVNLESFIFILIISENIKKTCWCKIIYSNKYFSKKIIYIKIKNKMNIYILN